MRLRSFLNRRWWLLALGAVIGGLAAYFATQHMQPAYRATTTVLINRAATPGSPNPQQPLSAEGLNTYAQLVKRPAVLDNVIQRLSLHLSREALAAKVEVSAIADTQLINVSVSDPNPELATIVAGSVAQAFIDDNAVQQPPTATISIAKLAETPRTPADPRLLVNVNAGVVVGLLLAGALCLLLGRLFGRVKGDDDFKPLAGSESSQARSHTAAVMPAMETPLYVAPPLNRRLGIPRRLARRESDRLSEHDSNEALERHRAALHASSLSASQLVSPQSVSAGAKGQAQSSYLNVQPAATDLLSATLNELLARADDTADMIRALRPNTHREEG